MSAAPRDPGSSNRRASIRKKPKGKVQLECRKGTMGLGANLALELWDLSQTGASLVVQPALKKGDEVEIRVSSTTMMRPLKVHGTVVWAQPLDAQRLSVGVHFHKQISYSEMNNLT